MTVEIPEEASCQPTKERLSNLVINIFLDIPQMAIYCDGEVIWTHLKKQKQVQINDYEEDEESEDIMSPKDVLKIYESGNYLYVLMNEATEKGVLIQQIEFKPKDRDSEYSKMRVTINKATSEIIRLKVFSRDGSRFTFAIDNETRNNKNYSADTFAFDVSKAAKDVDIEDLRMD